MKKFMSFLMAVMISTAAFAQKTLVSDAAHSRIQFTVVHLTINDIIGNFDKANLTIEADEKSFVNSKINFEFDINSINTHVEARDKHLKSADFFDAEKYQKGIFNSISLKKLKKDSYELTGNLEMHGVKKPVTLTLVYKGSTVNQMNKKTTHGYQVTGTLKRSDFGIGSKFPDAMISDNVRIRGDFELTEK